ncbi:MAG TPA: hypothetical protein DIW52_23835 [Pseudomonas sp.]|jgi:DNA-binding transcriptional LysR family regulator|nr:hypothetical protein [Pseudomonas sp.]
MDFNYNRVISYLKVVELKSFSRAAAQLNISTSMVSVHIKELEFSLGITLISRTTRSLALTEAGQRFYDDFSDIKQRIDCSLETLKDESEHICGVLRVVSPWDYGSRIIVPIIAEFSKLYPQLKIIHDVGLPLSNLANGKHDVAHKTTIRYGSNSLTLIHRMALFSLGIAALPDWMLKDDIQTSKLIRLFPNYEFTVLPVNALYPNCIKLPLKTRRFIDYMVAKLDTAHVGHQEQ